MSIYQKGRIPKRNVEKQSNRFLYISSAEAYRTKVLVEKVSIETSNLLLPISDLIRLSHETILSAEA